MSRFEYASMVDSILTSSLGVNDAFNSFLMNCRTTQSCRCAHVYGCCHLIFEMTPRHL
jgi:hypothetical protein